MRQRLGIATALIGDPEVLILDEPANGLDPAGIRWMRDLLRGFANRGGTVLLSSHLLHEIEVIADDIVVIGNGRIVAKGSKTDLLHAAGTSVRAVDLADSSMRSDSGGLRPPDRRRRAARRRDADLVGKIALDADVRAHGAAPRRKRRPGRDVPRAHRRHPTRRSSSMTAIAVDNVAPRARAAPTHPAPH